MKRHNVLPGFGPSLGYTIFYLSVIVLIPLSALVVKTIAEWKLNQGTGD